MVNHFIVTDPLSLSLSLSLSNGDLKTDSFYKVVLANLIHCGELVDPKLYSLM